MPKQITLPKGTVVPDHIAIVLDGNGRWARSRGLKKSDGHKAGYEAMKRVVRASRELGVHTLTVWGFSTENWKRPAAEKAKIMNLARVAVKELLVDAEAEGVRFIHLGRKDRLPKDLLKQIEKAEEKTMHNTKFVLNVAFDYGGQDELLRAIQNIVKDGINADKIDKKLFESYLDTGDQPFPYVDLFIRTSGEMRTSGLMPWQLEYAEFYFEEDHLPDMTSDKLKAAILDFSHRRRRFGGKDKKAKHFTFKPEVAANLELSWWRLSKIPEDQTFRAYAVNHLKEQWGMSKKHSLEAAKLMVQATIEGNSKKWGKAGKHLRGFYEIIKEEVTLAFEPKIAANFQIQLWQGVGKKQSVESREEIEEASKNLISEVYRISKFQASKAAHLRALATQEKALALENGGEMHWKKAEKYLQMYYRALKDRVA